jgi:tripartite-type tricarboxylate transporter receptor subunit TctC
MSMMARSLLIFAALVGGGTPCAQDYPSKPIRIVIPNPPGGALDTMGRVLGEKLREKWGQPVLPDNRPGAGGNIGAEVVAKAAPDGHTLLITAPGPLVVNKHLFQQLSFDPDTFAPVSVLMSAPNVLVVRSVVAAGNVRELIAFARANPGKMNYASQGNGTTAHLAAELFKSRAGVNLVHVPYKDSPGAVLALVSGHVDIFFADLGNALRLIQAGKVRALAVASEKRNSFLPELPAISEVLPGLVSTFWAGVVAPPGTPSVLATQISAAIAEALKRPDVLKQLHVLNFEPVGSTPAEMAAFLKQESERWGGVVRSAGIKAD